MSLYAKDTTVNVDRSRMEVHRLLRRYGALRVADAWEPGRAAIQFEIAGFVAKLTVPMPTEAEIKSRPRARRAPAAVKKALAKAERQRWRTLLLLLKAKLESCSLGITTFETEFLSALVTTDGKTVGERLLNDRNAHNFKLLPARGE